MVEAQPAAPLEKNETLFNTTSEGRRCLDSRFQRKGKFICSHICIEGQAATRESRCAVFWRPHCRNRRVHLFKIENDLQGIQRFRRV